MDFVSTIYQTALADGMPDVLAQLIAAQAAHETGNFTSNVFQSCNNAFGYKYVGQANATACTTSPEGDPYAAYDTVEDSVHEITAWINRRVNDGKFPSDLTTITDADTYAQLLKDAGYYGAPESVYSSGLQKYWQQFKDQLANLGAVFPTTQQ